MTDSKIDYVLDEQVARAAFLFQSRRQQQYLGRSLPLTLLQWLMGGALGGLVLIAALAGHGALAASFGVLLLFYLSLLAYRHLMCVLLGRKLAAAAGACSLSLSPEGLGSRSAIGEARYPWSQVREVSQQPGWLAICLGPQGLVLALPERALGDAGQRQALLDALAEGMALGRQQAVSAAEHVEASGSRSGDSGSPPAVAPAEAAPQAEAPAARSSLPGDLLQLGRILCLRAPRPGTLMPDPLRLLLPVLCFALLTLGLQVLSQGLQGELVGYDASQLLSPFAAVALVTALVLLVGGGRREGGRLGLALVLLMMLLPLAHGWNQELAMAVIESLGLEGEEGPGMVLLILIYYLPQCWLILAGSRVIWLLAGETRLRRWAAAGVGFLALTSVFWMHLEAPTLWYAQDPEAQARPRLRIDEGVLYGQPRLLERHLAGVKPGVPGVPEVFFLGVGGYGEQDVFLREVRSVEQLFAERYATAGHSLVLVNNQATIHELPTANEESLRRALARLGEQMNGEEDLLFLFLTSHGSREHRFSLSFWPFSFTDITPAMLRRALDDAGIQRRVVVVSACYSGGFIPALADARTLVISASAADRNSFGCSDGNDFTDFGRAYFDQALRQTRSFSEAFGLAASQVAAWEQADGLKASLPQMRGGAALEAQLMALAREEPAAVPELPPAPAPEPVYRRIAEILAPAPEERRYREICLEGLGESSPQRLLARDPSYFNGLEQDPEHWHRYLAAWENYAGDYCQSVGDPALIREQLARAWQRTLPAGQAASLAQWLESSQGQEFRRFYRGALVEEYRLLWAHSVDVQRRGEARMGQVLQDIRAAYAAREAAAAREGKAAAR